MSSKTLRVNLLDAGLKRRLELLNASPIMKNIDGLSAEQITNLPENDKMLVRKAVEDAIKQAQQEEAAASLNQKPTGEKQ